MTPVRIKNTKKEKDHVKELLLKRQKYVCPLCGGSLAGTCAKNIVLDHDHSTGIIRGAVHRGCNAIEGKIKYALTRYGRGGSQKEMTNFIAFLYHYWSTTSPESEWIYPTHKTEEEKRLARNAKQRKRYAATKVK